MKTNKHGGQNGGALIMVLLTIFVVAVALTSYLKVVQNQNYTVTRSTAWNQAIPVAEGGVEEALTQIHYCFIDNLTTNSWTLGVDGYYHKNRTNSDGSYYSVCIVPTNPPTIFSTGYVAVPLSTTTNYVSRRIKVLTRPPSSGGISAKGAINMNGGAYVDSYDSSNPAYSSNGQYVASMRAANVTVLTDSGASGAISAQTVYGTVVTGPTGTATGGPVGDAAYIAGGNTGIETGHSANNANVQFNDIPAPFTYSTGTTPLPLLYLIGGTNYTYNLSGGNYNMPSLSMSSSQGMYVSAPSVLYINGSVNLSGQSFIYIAPGGSLQMYINGSATLTGGGVVNGTGYATNLYVYGLPGCTSMSVGGGSAFCGIINAPEASFKYSGNADFFGSIIANDVTLTGGGNFHYDQSIAAKGGVVKSWNEF